MSTTDLIASIALIGGAVMSLLAGIAVVRFPDTMSRIHAATKPQVLGIILLMLGVGLRLQSAAVIGVLVLIVLLQFVTAPVSAHLAVRVAFRHATEEAGEETGERGADDSPAEFVEPTDSGPGDARTENDSKRDGAGR
jgi:multicomponent Na+:H+ antiporter subunit G